MNEVLRDDPTQTMGEEKIIHEYTDLVKRIAHHLIGKLPRTVQIDDLIQAGMVGLLEASKKFDDSKGASFETYAGIRIRGTMLDEVRRGNWVPRSVHRNARMISSVICELEHRNGRIVRDKEVAEALNISIEEYHQMLNNSIAANFFDVDDMYSQDELIDINNAPGANDPFEGVQMEAFCQRLSEGVTSLPERERLVISLYYNEELNLKEIGEVLGVSESRICQIHSQAMSRLQARIGMC